jgi:hypothetical protein
LFHSVTHKSGLQWLYSGKWYIALSVLFFKKTNLSVKSIILLVITSCCPERTRRYGGTHRLSGDCRVINPAKIHENQVDPEGGV